MSDDGVPPPSTTQTFGITVTENHAPAITSTPPTEVTAGLPYRYDVVASDADGDSLTYALVAAFPDMDIDRMTGAITWSPGLNDIGSSTVQVQVADGWGKSADQTYTLTVAADTQAPAVNVALSRNPVDIGDRYDDAGRVIETDFADGTKTTTNYDDVHHTKTDTDQNQVKIQYISDNLGRLIQVISGLGTPDQEKGKGRASFSRHSQTAMRPVNRSSPASADAAGQSARPTCGPCRVGRGSGRAFMSWVRQP